MVRRIKNAANKKIYIILSIFAVGLLLFMYMVFKGAINYNLISNCKDIPVEKFCGLKIIDLAVPDDLKREILKEVSGGQGTRVVIPGWKAGRTISTATIQKNMPRVYDWYKSIEGYISSIIGESVYVTPDRFPTTCAILIYEEDGDFINWHYDVNYFDGRFFTLIVPVTITNTCTEYVYYDKDGNKKGLQEERGKAILFEGDKVFHMASAFCNKGEKRVMISVQFSTNPNINWFNNILMRIKDIAYIGY